MGGKSSTVTSTTKPPPQVMQAYESLLAQATPVANKAYQPYTGGFEQNQMTGFNTIAGLNGSSNGYFGNAATDLANAAVPTSATVNQYMSPYLSDVVNSTIANMNEQNAEQQQGVLGNAIAQGALGGNRVGVAQGELARQQNLANQATIANLYNTGYNSALGAAQAQQQADIGAASGLAGLGSTAMQTNLQQAAAQVGAGTQQQQWNYQQYQNALSYPFETTSWLANIVEGLGSGMGGTTTQTSPAGNTGSAVLGGILGLASLFKDGGSVHRPQRAQGGIIPYSNPSGIMSANDNGISGANDNGSYVPQVATAGAHLNAPQIAKAPSTNDSQQMLQQGLGAVESSLKQKYPNGILAGFGSPSLPQTAPIPTPSPLDNPSAAQALAPVVPQPTQSTGILSSLGNLFGLKNGGVARGYDAGGYVDPFDPRFAAGSIGQNDGDFDPLNDPVVTPLERGTQAFVPPLPAPVNIQDRPVVAPTDFASTPDNAPVPQADPQRGIVPAVAHGVVPNVTPANADMGTEASVMATDGRYDPAISGQPVTSLFGDVTPPAGRPSDVMASSGAQGAGNGLLTAFSRINNAAGLPPDYLTRTAQIESHFDPNANNGIAAGMFQFTAPTAREYGLSNPYDPIASATAAAKLADNNSRFLSSGLGRSPTGGELYLAHQQGASGALNLLTHPNNLATDIVGRKAVIENGGKPDMTAAQFANMWISKYNGDAPPSPAAGALNNLANGQPMRVAENSTPAGVVPQSGASSAASAPSSQSYPMTAVPPTQGVVPSVQGDQTPHEGVLSSLLHGHGLNLTNDQRFALLQAGLGMMSGTSPNFLTNVGTGGLKGLEAYQQRQALNRENAVAQSEINLGSENTAIAGGRLALEARNTAKQIANETATTQAGVNLTNTEAATKRWQQTVTPAGIIVRDMVNPENPPRLISWQQLQTEGASAIPGLSQAPAASPASPMSASVTPSTVLPTDAPVTAAPIKPVGSAPLAEAGPFISSAPAQVPVDGRLFTPTGQQIVTNETNDALKEARSDYLGATSMQTQLGEMKHDLSNIPATAWTSPGNGFQARVNWAKGINTAFQAAGFQAPINEKAVASGEDLNKLTTRLGFDLSRTLGSREAGMIVQEAVGAVPGGANSPQGAARIIAGIEAANQRKIDYYNFVQDWAAKSGGSIKGADQYFNQHNPPELYAIASYVPAPAISYLRQHPDLASAFDQKYGKGTSQYVLGSE